MNLTEEQYQFACAILKVLLGKDFNEQDQQQNIRDIGDMLAVRDRAANVDYDRRTLILRERHDFYRWKINNPKSNEP